MGALYKRGDVWWIKYYADGVARRETTGCTGEREATLILKQREGAAASGQPILPRADRGRYEEIAQDLREQYEATGDRNLTEVGYRLGPLGQFFKLQRVAGLDKARATKYVLWRRAQGVSNATINREL